MRPTPPRYEAILVRVASLVAAVAFLGAAAFLYQREGLSFLAVGAALFAVAFLGSCLGTEAHLELILASGLFLLFAATVGLGLFNGFLWLSTRLEKPVRVSRESAAAFYWSLQVLWSLLALYALHRAIRAWASLRGRAVEA